MENYVENTYPPLRQTIVDLPSVDLDSDPIASQSSWRVQQSDAVAAGKILVTRWRGLVAQPSDFSSLTPDNCHVVMITLRRMDIRLSASGHVVHDGPVPSGAFHVSEPCQQMRCAVKGLYDILHLFVPNLIVDRCAGELFPTLSSSFCWLSSPKHDPAVAALARTLLLPGEQEFAGDNLCTDHIGIAILSRLMLATYRMTYQHQKMTTGLPRWRLKRAVDYIDANIEKPLTLAEIAAATGLSRMHFAAQFRRSVGQRPHEYLLQRRVERAQEMLLGTDLPIVEIALSVGFQAQSHFTTIFKRFAGQPPRLWRLEHGHNRR